MTYTLRPITALIAACTLVCLAASATRAEVIAADDFLYSQPTKDFGPGGGFNLQDYGGGQNGAAGSFAGRWVSSGDGIITGADFIDNEDFQFGVVLGQTFSPTDTFIQRNYQLDGFAGTELYFGVLSAVDVDTMGSPRMYIHNPLNEDDQIAIGFDEFGGIHAQLGTDFDNDIDDVTNDGEYHQLVAKLEINANGNNERLTVWLDPTGVEEGDSISVQADVIASAEDLSGLLRLSRFAAGGNVFFDNAAMGTAWADVVNVNVPRMTLQVDEATGAAALVNGTSQPFDLSFYELESESGSLNLGGWNSLADQSRPGWMENNSNESLIVESNFSGSTTVPAGGSLSLGTIASNAPADLVARFGTTDGLLNVAPVSFGTIVGTSGDFDGNGVLDANDIDLLSAEVRTGNNPASFDVNGDGSVNNADRTVWVESLRSTYFGDSNLDGEFNSGDFVTVFTAGQYEDGVLGNSTWATGDWNGDTEFDSSDFVTAFSAGGYEIGPRAAVAAVPEPASVTLLLFGLLACCGRYRR